MRSTPFLLLAFFCGISFSLHAHGRFAVDFATHDKYDSWASEMQLGAQAPLGHYFDMLRSDQREEIEYNTKEWQFKFHFDQVVQYTYHLPSGWYGGFGFSSIRTQTTPQAEVKANHKFFLEANNKDGKLPTFYLDSFLCGGQFVRNGFRGKGELVAGRGGGLLRAILQRNVWSRNQFYLDCYIEGSTARQIDLQAAIRQVIEQRTAQSTELQKLQKFSYKDTTMLGAGCRVTYRDWNIGVGYRLTRSELLQSRVSTAPFAGSTFTTAVPTKSVSLKKQNDIAAGFELELPSPAHAPKKDTKIKELPLTIEKPKTTIPAVIEKHVVIFDVTYSWDQWRACVYYQTGTAAYPDSAGLRVSYHF